VIRALSGLRYPSRVHMFSRRRVGGLVVALLTLLLAACHSSSSTSASVSPTTQFIPTASASASASVSASASASAHPSITPSTTLDGITVTGDLGKLPTVKIPAPWGVDKTQAKTLIQGTGPEVTASSMIEVNYWGANGYTGKVFD